jgi:carbon-monoxide dehydrogenase small subunit
MIALTVNGTRYERTVETRVHLGDFLRQGLELTGTHLGCEHGVCGACTVLVNGSAVRSCLMLAVQADGAEIRTIEGLAGADGTLHPVQAALWEHHGLQCGFCTPGILTTLVGYLEVNPEPTERDIREAISGNICRCTGYQAIVEAGLDAAQRMRTQEA